MLARLRHHFSPVFAALFAPLLGAGQALAQPVRPSGPEASSEGAAGRLRPPTPIETPVTYPEDGSGEAAVVLELTIDPEGRIVEVKSLTGDSPFREAAVNAARSWRFEPASRDGRNVAARIRYTLNYAPPEKAVEAATPVRAPASATKGAAPARRARKPVVAPLDVVVRGDRPPVGSVTVTHEEARILPGSFGDPLRAIEAQPGVVPIVSGLPAFFIRGAPPANVGFFFDGVDLPLLYHAFFGPSVMHPSLIDRVEFYPGAAPVQYGRFSGPIIAVQERPFKGRRSGEASLRIIDVGALAESGPLVQCGGPAEPACSETGVRLAGRYSYAGLVLSLLSDAELRYWDYQAEVRHPLGTHDTVSVLAFGGYDFFRPPQQADNTGGKVDFHRTDLRWDHRTTSGGKLRLAVTGGFDRAAGATEDSSLVSDTSLRGRFELGQPLDEAATLRIGADARADRFGLETSPRNFNYPDYSTLFPERTEVVAGAYVGVELRPTRHIQVSPGLRADVYRGEGVTRVGFDPRISAEFAIGRDLTLEDSIGILHQRPNFTAQIPGAQIADLKGGLQWALLWSSAMRLRLPGDFSASASVFRSAYFNALDPIGGARDFTLDRTVLDRRSTVSAMGIELHIARPLTRKLGGFASYTLSRSEQSAENRKTISGFDRPHVLQAALSYDFGSNVRVGARAVFYSGIPELNLEGTARFTGARRGTPFFRTDLRAEKRFRLGNDGYWGIIAEILNATATREVIRLDCGEICRERVAGPVVLPSVGIEAGL